MDVDKLPPQASQLWSMLDDMANNNPAAYKKFIDKQLKEGKESLSPPKPYFAIETIFIKSRKTLYINVFGFHRIKKPPTDEDPVNMVSGETYEIKFPSSVSAKAISIAMHPDVLDRFGPESKHELATKENKDALVSLCIDFCQDQLKEELTHGCRVISKPETHKGDLKSALKSLRWTGPISDEVVNTISGAANSCDISSMSTKDIVNKINDYVEGNESVSSSGDASSCPSEYLSELKLPGSQQSDKPKKNLIEEISEPENSASDKSKSVETLNKCCSTTNPRYSLEHNDNDELVLSVLMKGVTSVKQCQLDISSSEILLTVENDPNQKLLLKWPHRVTEDKAKAQFKKKISRLLITVPINK